MHSINSYSISLVLISSSEVIKQTIRLRLLYTSAPSALTISMTKPSCLLYLLNSSFDQVKLTSALHTSRDLNLIYCRYLRTKFNQTNLEAKLVQIADVRETIRIPNKLCTKLLKSIYYFSFRIKISDMMSLMYDNTFLVHIILLCICTNTLIKLTNKTFIKIHSKLD